MTAKCNKRTLKDATDILKDLNADLYTYTSYTYFNF